MKRVSAGREFLVTAAGQVVGLIGTFFAVKILSSSLGSEAYGRMSLGLAGVALAHLLFYSPTANVILRNYASYHARGKCRQFLATVRLFLAGASGILLMVGMLIAAAISAYVSDSDIREFVLVSLVYAILSGIFGDTLFLFNAARRRATAGILLALDAWLRPLAALMMFEYFGASATTAMMAFALVSVGGLILQHIMLGKNFCLAANVESDRATSLLKDVRKDFFQYGSPFFLMAGIMAITSYADRWILLALQSEAVVGIYSAIYQVANAPILLFFGIINQFMFPVVFADTNRNGSGDGHLSRRNVVRYAMGSAIVFVAITTLVSAIYGQQLLTIFTAPEFAVEYELLWIFCLAHGVGGVAQLLMLKWLIEKKPERYLASRIIQAGVLVIGGIGATYFFGAKGMAFCFLAAALVLLAATAHANSAAGSPLRQG